MFETLNSDHLRSFLGREGLVSDRQHEFRTRCSTGDLLDLISFPIGCTWNSPDLAGHLRGLRWSPARRFAVEIIFGFHSASMSWMSYLLSKRAISVRADEFLSPPFFANASVTRVHILEPTLFYLLMILYQPATPLAVSPMIPFSIALSYWSPHQATTNIDHDGNVLNIILAFDLDLISAWGSTNHMFRSFQDFSAFRSTRTSPSSSPVKFWLDFCSLCWVYFNTRPVHKFFAGLPLCWHLPPVLLAMCLLFRARRLFYTHPSASFMRSSRPPDIYRTELHLSLFFFLMEFSEKSPNRLVIHPWPAELGSAVPLPVTLLVLAFRRPATFKNSSDPDVELLYFSLLSFSGLQNPQALSLSVFPETCNLILKGRVNMLT